MRNTQLELRWIKEGILKASGELEPKLEKHTGVEPIAIVGLAGSFPQADSVSEFWQKLDSDQTLIEEIPRSRFDWQQLYDEHGQDPTKLQTKWGGFIPEVAAFDPQFFNIMPAEAKLMDPRQRLLLMAVYHCLEDAGYAPDSMKKSATGVFVGCEDNEYVQLLAERGADLGEPMGHAASMIANRLSYFFDFRGPSEFINTMCSGAAVALHRAVTALRAGEIDQAVVAAVNLLLRPEPFMGLSAIGQLSRDARVHSFGKDAQGFVRAEGVGSVLLKPLARAEADGDAIFAVIKHSAVNYNGQGATSIAAPNTAAHVDVIKRCYGEAGIDPRRVTYIEAQGMGNPVADIAEWNALNRALISLAKDQNVRLATGNCAVSTLKPLTGHMHAASALGALFKIIKCLRADRVYKILDFKEVNPELETQGQPCRLLADTQSWPKSDDLRLAGLHSYGSGGNNAHILIEEYRKPRPAVKPVAQSVLLPVSARSLAQCQQLIKDLIAYVQNKPDVSLQQIAHTLQVGRDALEHRVAFVARNREAWLLQAQRFLEGEQVAGVFVGQVGGAKARKLQSGNPAEMAAAWVSGTVLPKPTRGMPLLHLPTYPFATNDYWVDDAPLVQPTIERAAYKASSLTKPAQAEPALRQILSAFLEIPAAEIQMEREFSTLGFNSLLVVHLASKIEAQFGFKVEPALFFEYTTPAQLALYLDQQSSGDASLTPVTGWVAADVHASQVKNDQIAIIGLAGSYPQAPTLEQLWQNLAEGRDCIEEVPSTRWSLEDYYDPDPERARQTGKSYGKWGGFIDGLYAFDPRFFKLSPREAEYMNPKDRLFLQTAWHVLEDAGYPPQQLAQERVGVFAGVTRAGVDLQQSSAFSVANRVSYTFDFHGPSMTIDTACSSSLVAIHEACRNIHAGECSVAIAGGVHAFLHPTHFVALSHAQMLSPDGKCKTFGAQADGMVPGEGVGAVLLKPLSRALADGDAIYGVIRGSEVNHGGKTNGFTVPNPKAHSELVRGAMARGDVHARQVSYVEAHGTGTSLGDPIEVRGLAEAFRQDTDEVGFCSIGSIKSNIGHLEAAAGISGITKILLQLKHRKLVPSLHSSELNPHIDFANSPFCVQQELQDWQPTDADGKRLPRMGCVSSFGAGGTNAHVIIEEYVDVAQEDDDDAVLEEPVIIVLSARTDDQLRQLAQSFQAYLNANQALPKLRDIAYTLQVGRQPLDERLGFVVASLAELKHGLAAFLEGGDAGLMVQRGRVKSDKASLALFEDEDIAAGVSAWFEKRKYSKVLDLWLQGFPVDWLQLYGDSKPRRVSLPTYPFARDYFRPPETDARQHGKVAAAVAQDATSNALHTQAATREDQESPALGAERKSSIQTMISQPIWQDKAVEAVQGSPTFDEQLVLLCDLAIAPPNGQLGKATYKVLRSSGSDCGQNFQEIALQTFEILKTLVQQRTRAFVQILVPHSGSGRLAAALSAMLKTAQQETPKIAGQVIEVDPALSLARLAEIVAQNSRMPEDAHVRYRAGKRQVLGWQPTALADAVGEPWKAHGVFLITGGAGGLGLLFARELAADGRTLILLGRSPLKAATQAKLHELEAQGARVEYHAVDVSDQAAVQSLIEDVKQRFGGLNGIIHAAGLLRDSLMLKKTEADFTDVLAAKVAGTVLLDQATTDLDLDFFVLFSSTSAVLGNPGQADYATANAFMDSFASYRNDLVLERQRRGKTLSVNWPFWQDGGMQISADAEEQLQQMGMVALPTASGIRALIQGLSSDASQLMVIEGDQARIQAAFAPPKAPAEKSTTSQTKPDLSTAKTADYLKTLLSTTLKLPAQEIQAEAPLEIYGIDSIMAMEMTHQLEAHFGTLSKTLFYEYQTIQELAEYFLTEHTEAIQQLFPAVQALKAEARVPADEVVSQKSAKQATSVQSRVVPHESSDALDVAIVGLSGRYPQAANLEAFWQNLAAGKDCITEVPKDRWDWREHYDETRQQVAAHYSKWGGFIDDADKFDPLFFNISPREAQFYDPQERIFLESSWAALEDAGYSRTAGNLPTEVGVYAGVTYSEYQLYGAEASALGTPMALGGNYASIANRVSYLFNFQGPSMTTDTMCSSSLTTIHQACQDLMLGRIEMALAGGVNLTIHPNKYLKLSIGQFISSKGHCESFGEGGDGYIPGEGVGVVVLKRLTEAERDGDHIYGVIKGSAINHGGKTNGYSVPSPHAQADVIKRAMQQAKVDARQISFIEAHGTGTKLGDPIEITGLSKAFKADKAGDPKTGWCAIGSVKSNIGHCESAAGIAGVTKVLLQMKAGCIAPSLHSKTLNPHIDFHKTPFVVNQELQEWTRPVIDGKTVPRIAGVSSFGAGGSNAHVIIEEYVAPQASLAQVDLQQGVMIPLSAKNANRLRELVQNLLDFLQASDSVDLASLGYTLQVGREALEERLGLLVHSKQELVNKLQQFLTGKAPGEAHFQGHVKRHNHALDAFKTDEDFAETLNAWFEKRKYARLLELWVKGLEIDWNRLYPTHKPKRVSLPTYPFARERYWVPAVHSSAKPSNLASKAIEAPIEQASELVTLEPVWQVATHLEAQEPPSETEKLLVIGGTAQQVATLSERFPHVNAIDFDGDSSIQDMATHLETLSEPDEIVWIAPHAALSSAADEVLLSDQQQGVVLLFRLVKALLSLGYGNQTLRWTIVTTQSVAIHKGDSLNPAHASLHGFAGCLAKEYAHWPLRLLDVEPDWDLNETFQLPFQPQGSGLVWRKGQWYQPELRPTTSLTDENDCYRQQGVYVVIGGAGGIGAAWSKWMMQHYDARIIWIGRRSKDATIQAKLDELTEFGTPPTYIQADATQRESLRQAYQAIKQNHAEIHGVVHSAIVLLDRSLARMDEADFKTGLATKVDISVRMAQVFAEEPLDFALFFSSMSSFTRPPGQSNYAAGCVFKDVFAKRLAQDWACAVKVINWGFWGSVGVAADDYHRDRMLREGVGSIEPEEAMPILQSLIAGSHDQIGLVKVLGDQTTRESKAGKEEVSKNDTGKQSSASTGQSFETIQRKLMQVIRDLLLLPDGHVLDGEATFSDLGLDSISSVGFIRGLSEEYGVNFRETLVFDYPTIDSLTEYIQAELEKLPTEQVGEPEKVEIKASKPSAPPVPSLKHSFKQQLGLVMAQHHTVVPLQTAGDGPIVFCLHPMSGDVGVYGKLAEAAQQRFRVIGLRAKGFLYDEPRMASIEDMARDHVQVIATIDPQGPYHLLGVSVGGTIAYEIARQLQLQGKTVASLQLGEAPLIENDEDAQLWDSDVKHNWIMNANFLMISMLHLDPEFRARKAAGKEDWGKLRITKQEAGDAIPACLPALIKKRGVAQSEAILLERLTYMSQTHLNNLRALNRYRAKPVKHTLNAVLLRTRTAQATSAEVYNPDYLINIQKQRGGFAHFLKGWQRVLPELETFQVNGEDHFDLLSSAETVAHVADSIAVMTTGCKVSAKPDHTGKIAIVGIAGQFPGGQTPEALWQLLKEGKSALSSIPSDRDWPELPGEAKGGFLKDIDKFDPNFFQIAPKEAEKLDPAERLFLQSAWHAIEDAGIDPKSLSGKSWGVFCGGNGDYTLRLKEVLGVSLHLTSNIPGRVSYSLNLTGPALTFDVGCASSLMALTQACDALLLNRCEAAIAGGVSIASTENILLATSEMLSKGTQGQAFDAEAKGMIPGEGVGVVVLKHLDQALADQDRIYGVIEGWASNSSGKTNGMAAPSVSAETALFADVYKRFQIDPASIGFVEANATGTPLGDMIEVQALTEAFRQHTSKRNFCALGSIENNIGHAWQASGMAHLFKVLLALKHAEIPPTLNAETPNPALDLANSPFFINTQSVPWVSDQIRRAALNSFGDPGTSVHMVISEPPQDAAKVQDVKSVSPALVVLSAMTGQALRQRCKDLLELDELPPLAQLSANLLLRRSHFPVRCAFVADDLEHLRVQLEQFIEGKEPETCFSGTAAKKVRPSLAQMAETTAHKDALSKPDLLLMADLYVQGMSLNLAQHFCAEAKRPVSLPGYPFAKKRCWIGGEDVAVAEVVVEQASNTAEVVAAHVRSITGHEADEIDFDAPFSQFGMDSLMSIRLLATINEDFSLAIDLNDLLDYNSIRQVAELIDRESAVSQSAPNLKRETFEGGAHWLADRGVLDGLYMVSVEAEQEADRSMLTDSAKAILSQLLQQTVALFHEGARCYFVAHQAVDLDQVLEGIPSDQLQTLLAQVPLKTLIAPISQEQFRNLYHSEVMQQSAWNIQHVYESNLEELDLDVLNQAMAHVVQNQDGLRTYFPAIEESWGQFIAPIAELKVELIECSDLDGFKAHVAEARTQLLQVAQIPIFHAWVCEIEDSYYFGFVTHHCLADAFTTTMLFSELMSYYHALIQDQAAKLIPVAEQYWSFALKQVALNHKQATKTYWQQQLKGSQIALQLPYCRDPKTLTGEAFHEAEAHMVSVSPELCEAIKAFNIEHDITYTQLFTAAVAWVLIHGMDNPKAVFHFYNSQRDRASLLNTLGEFTNILFMLLDMDPNDTIMENLKQVKRKSAEVLRYAKLDFSQLLQAAGMESHEAYFRQTSDVVIDSADIDTSTLNASNPYGRSLYAEFSEDHVAPKMQATGTLFYQVLKVNQRIHLLVTYRKHLFDAGELYGLSNLIVGLVETMVRNPESRLKDALVGQEDALKQLKTQVARFKPQQVKPLPIKKAPRFPELVLLNRDNGQRPVFWIHGGLGGVEGYYRIAQKSSRPFYGVQARGWMTDRTPMQGIRAMAAFYIHAIQSVQPEGPYDLGGYSLGGLLAYEVTRQLQELGEVVNTITMLDSFDGAKNHTPDHLQGKLTLFHAVNQALTFTIRDQPEKVPETLLHREEVDPTLDEDAFLDQLIGLAKTRGLTKTKKQLQQATRQNADVVTAYREREYNTPPLPNPEAVTCYYFRNMSGLFLGEFEPYFTIPGVEISVEHTRYWALWEEHLPNLHIMDVDASSHMTFLAEPKVHETIISFCEGLYSKTGFSKTSLEQFKQKMKQEHGVLKADVENEEPQ